MEDTAVIIAMEHTTVHATDHTREWSFYVAYDSAKLPIFPLPTPPSPYLVVPFGRW